MKPFDPSSWDGAHLLLLAPHPDDEVLGCGGTLARAARAGAHVHVVVMADGAGGLDGEADVAQRAEEARAACGFLGLSPPALLACPSAELIADPAAAGVQLSRVFPEHAFDVVLAPWPLERHATHRATLLAALLGAPVADSARWYGYGVWDAVPAGPTTLEVDVTSVRAAKAKALSAHGSQSRGRSLLAGMTSRDLAQAVFSRLSGSEERRAVERLLDLGDLASRVRAADDVPGVIREWVVEAERARAAEHWGAA